MGGLLLAPVVVASTSLKSAVALSITMAVVTIPTMAVASLVKTRLPLWLRIPMYTLIASLLLIPAGMLVVPIASTIFDSMGMYFSLMIFNSVLFTRAEKLAIKSSPGAALLDGACYSLGFALAISLIAAVRELLASNTLWGVPINLPFKVSALALPFAGFLLVGMFAAIGRFFRELAARQALKRRRHRLATAPAQPAREEVAQ